MRKVCSWSRCWRSWPPPAHPKSTSTSAAERRTRTATAHRTPEPQHAGRAHDRHGEPGLQAVVRRQQRPRLRLEVRRSTPAIPTAAKGYEARSPTRSPSSSGSRRTRSVARYPVQQVVRARARRTSTSRCNRSRSREERAEAVDFSDGLLRREPGADRRQRLACDRRDHARRPEGSQARRAGRDDKPAGHPAGGPAQRRAQVYPDLDTALKATSTTAQVDGVVVDFPTAFYGYAERDRRAVPDRERWPGAVRSRVREGELARRVRRTRRSLR